MAQQNPCSPPKKRDACTTRETNIRVAKKKPKPRIRSFPGLKRRSGLLNTTILMRSEPMQIAKRNSLQSPLLRLPGEIRNLIWTYAVGEHQVRIRDPRLRKQLRLMSEYQAFPLYNSISDPLRRRFVVPTFQLPQVCRQIYCEASPLVYTQNRFSFDSLRAMDKWIKNRPLGQKCLVTSIDVPFEYMRLYYGSFRKLFRDKFPNIKRIGVPSIVLYLSRELNEREEDTENRIVFNIKKYEGQGVNVVCHGRTKT